MTKQLLIQDIYQGGEVIVPSTLLVSNLPLSYRFYDYTLRLIQDECSDQNKNEFGLKYWQMLQRISDDMGLKRKIMEMTGLKKLFLKQAEKPIYRYQSLSDGQGLLDEIDHQRSEHSRSLQLSKYITIENNQERLKQVVQISQQKMFDNNDDGTIR